MIYLIFFLLLLLSLGHITLLRFFFSCNLTKQFIYRMLRQRIFSSPIRSILLLQYMQHLYVALVLPRSLLFSSLTCKSAFHSYMA